MLLKAGDKAPAFSLQNQDGKTRTLGDYAGKWLVLYVYPKDDTPGCTIEGQGFTATKTQFDTIGVNVVGLSADDVESHKNFCKKYNLTVELLSDPNAKLLTALGVGQTEHKGAMYWNRTTFLIDPSGKIRKVYEKVVPQGHEELLLKDIQEIKRTR